MKQLRNKNFILLLLATSLIILAVFCQNATIYSLSKTINAGDLSASIVELSPVAEFTVRPVKTEETVKEQLSRVSTNKLRIKNHSKISIDLSCALSCGAGVAYYESICNSFMLLPVCNSILIADFLHDSDGRK